MKLRFVLYIRPGKFSAVGVGLDLTKRELQSKLKQAGLPWERAKAFDGSALFSDFVCIELIEEKLTVELTIDGEVMQQGCIAQMMYKPDEILKQLSSFMTLEDGDIVMTGTPKGVGEVKQGKMYQARILLDNKCLVEQQWQAS